MELRARKEKPLRYKSLSGAIIPASAGYVNEVNKLSSRSTSGTDAVGTAYLPAIIGRLDFNSPAHFIKAGSYPLAYSTRKGFLNLGSYELAGGKLGGFARRLGTIQIACRKQRDPCVVITFVQDVPHHLEYPIRGLAYTNVVEQKHFGSQDRTEYSVMANL